MDAAASAVPRPIGVPVLDPLDSARAAEDLPCLLALLPEAGVYLQSEVENALLPTLTRVWSLGGRGKRAVRTPRNNADRYGFGAVDSRDGALDRAVVDGWWAAPFCEELRRLLMGSTEWARGPSSTAIISASVPPRVRAGCGNCWES